MISKSEQATTLYRAIACLWDAKDEIQEQDIRRVPDLFPKEEIVKELSRLALEVVGLWESYHKSMEREKEWKERDYQKRQDAESAMIVGA